MAIAALFKKIEEFGIAEQYFEHKPIGQIEKCCCPASEVEAIDFDKTKEKLSAEFDLKQPKSCDALKLVYSNSTIDFIEFKGWREYIKHTKGNINGENIDKKLIKFNLIDKIRDSYFLLETLIRKNKFDLNQTEKTLFNSIKVNFIVLVDIDIEQNPIENLTFTLSFLSQASSDINNQISSDTCKLITNKIDEHLSNISNVASNRLFNRPIILSCSRIAAHYN